MFGFNLSQRKVTILIILVVGIFVLHKVMYFLQTEKTKIRRTIFSAKKSTEKENLMKCLSFIDYGFSDNYENDRSALAMIGRSVFKQYDDIKISVKELEIAIDDSKAEALVNTAGFGKNVRNNKIEHYTLKFKITFIKKDNRWLVIRIEWLEPENLFSAFIS